tara:strand:- start:3302 stop:3496 length:195 start_codon:yes stop_codon:yes gene_type:complete
MKITILEIRLSMQEDNVYVFKDWVNPKKLQPFIKQWLNDWDLKQKDQNDTWSLEISHTKITKLS